VQKVFDPCIRIAMVPVKIYAIFAGSLIAVLLWPFKKTYECFKKPA
jgi:hypothetical protein